MLFQGGQFASGGSAARHSREPRDSGGPHGELVEDGCVLVGQRSLSTTQAHEVTSGDTPASEQAGL